MLLATVAADATYVAYFVVAELLVVFSTWAQVALDLYSRSGLLDLAEKHGVRPQVEGRLERSGAYELSVRIARFLGSAMLVAGIAFVVLRDHLVGATDVPRGIPWGPLGATLAVTFVVNFLVNDLAVRLAAQRRPEAFLLRALPYLEWLRIVTTPIRLPLTWIVRLVFRANLEEPLPSARQEVLESVEEGERAGSLTADEADMIESIIDLEKTTAEDLLTPRGEIAMLQADTSIEDAVRYVLETGRRRIPIYGRDRDDVVGVVHALDLLKQMVEPHAKERVREIMRSPFFVPEGKPLNDLLAEFRTRRVSLAVVLNEFGGTAGLVTIEDVLEEIVGEIENEHDQEEPAPTVRNGTVMVEGRTPIEDVNEMLSISLPVEEDFETVGGLIFHHMGKVPQRGDEMEVAGVALRVTEADERTVQRVQIHVPKPADG